MMNREDLLALIVEHAENQGLLEDSWFAMVQTMTNDELENYLDIIVERIRNSGKHYDAVVGIKTGGAIISDYVSLKLGLPNYKIKL